MGDREEQGEVGTQHRVSSLGVNRQDLESKDQRSVNLSTLGLDATISPSVRWGDDDHTGV